MVLEDESGRVLGSGFIDGGNGHSGRRAAEILFGLDATDPRQDLTLHVQWHRPRRMSSGDDGAYAEADGWTTYPRAVRAAEPRGLPSGDPARAPDVAARSKIAGWCVVVVGEESHGRSD